METTDLIAERTKVLASFYSWEAQIRFCLDMEGCTATAANEAVLAIHTLRGFLGDTFPDEALRDDHPIGEYFINNVPWPKSG